MQVHFVIRGLFSDDHQFLCDYARISAYANHIQISRKSLSKFGAISGVSFCWWWAVRVRRTRILSLGHKSVSCFIFKLTVAWRTTTRTPQGCIAFGKAKSVCGARASKTDLQTFYVVKNHMKDLNDLLCRNGRNYRFSVVSVPFVYAMASTDQMA